MLFTSILDVALGVVFAFLAVSLVTSALVEAVNSLLNLRARSLLAGIKSLVNDPAFDGLARELYKHAAVSPRGAGDSGDDTTAAVLKHMPAYVDPKQFASALLDVTGLSTAGVAAAGRPAAQAVADLQAALAAASPNMQVAQWLQGVVQRSKGDIDAVRLEVANWFDNAMDRVGGTFKRRTQLISFVFALLIAAVLNVDTVHLATALWEHPIVASRLQIPPSLPVNADGTAPDASALETAAQTITQALETDLPVGWAPGHFLEVAVLAQAPDATKFVNLWQAPRFGTCLVGWLLTAAATLFGAPFWFDTLQTFVRLKGAGPSPAEKKDRSAASA